MKKVIICYITFILSVSVCRGAQTVSLMMGWYPFVGRPIQHQGTKALGMGGAFCAVADDISAIYWNPAGLGQLEDGEVSDDDIKELDKGIKTQ